MPPTSAALDEMYAGPPVPIYTSRPANYEAPAGRPAPRPRYYAPPLAPSTLRSISQSQYWAPAARLGPPPRYYTPAVSPPSITEPINSYYRTHLVTPFVVPQAGYPALPAAPSTFGPSRNYNRVHALPSTSTGRGARNPATAVPSTSKGVTAMSLTIRNPEQLYLPARSSLYGSLR